MASKMGVRAVFAILIIHACMEGFLAAEVPSKFLGLWEGSAVDVNEVSWKVLAGVTGGSSIAAFMQVTSSGNVCTHLIKIAAGKGKEKSNEDIFEAKTDVVASHRSFASCWIGSFKFEANRTNRTLLDIVWQDEETGKVIDEWSFILKRIDDGSLAQALDTCKANAAPSPLTKLKSKLSCKDAGDRKKRG